jgi:hypothetical protein
MAAYHHVVYVAVVGGVLCLKWLLQLVATQSRRLVASGNGSGTATVVCSCHVCIYRCPDTYRHGCTHPVQPCLSMHQTPGHWQGDISLMLSSLILHGQHAGLRGTISPSPGVLWFHVAIKWLQHAELSCRWRTTYLLRHMVFALQQLPVVKWPSCGSVRGFAGAVWLMLVVRHVAAVCCGMCAASLADAVAATLHGATPYILLVS